MDCVFNLFYNTNIANFSLETIYYFRSCREHAGHPKFTVKMEKIRLMPRKMNACCSKQSEPSQNPGNNHQEHKIKPAYRNKLSELNQNPGKNSNEHRNKSAYGSKLFEPTQKPGNNRHERGILPVYCRTRQLNHNPEGSPCVPSQNCAANRCQHGQYCRGNSSSMEAPAHGSLWGRRVSRALIQRWESEQLKLREQLITEDAKTISSWLFQNSEKSVKEFYIGGADISFIKGNSVDACACLTVVRMSDLQVVYQRIQMIQLSQPYVPGYLAFREVQPLVDLYNHLRVAAPHYLPDIIMVDGNGVLHPRGFGLACHLGVLLRVPTLGVAKTLLATQGIHDDTEHQRKKQALKQAGDSFDLVSDRGHVLGRCVRTGQRAPTPVYISVGHRVTLESATQISLQCSKYRIPEPVRRSDLDSRKFLSRNKVEPYEFIKRMPDHLNHSR